MSDDDVGYGRPPKKNQFKAGEPSPNPGGRPKRSGSPAHRLAHALGEKIPVGDEMMSKLEAIVEQLVNKAMTSTRAAKLLAKYYPKDAPESDTPCGVLVVGPYLSPEEWYAQVSQIEVDPDPLKGLPGLDPEMMRRTYEEKQRLREKGYDDSGDAEFKLED